MGPAGAAGPIGPAGAAGPQGPAGPSLTTAFGSFYSIATTAVLVEETISAPAATASVNITSTPSSFTVAQSGFYFITYGVSSLPSEIANPTVIDLVVDGVVVPGARLNLPAEGDQLVSLSIIVALTAGQTVEMVNNGDLFVVGTTGDEDVSAFIDLIRLSPL